MLYLCIAGRPNGYGLVFYFLTQHSNVIAQENKEQTAGRDQLGDFAPKFAELNDRVLGEVWSRTDRLGLRDRSLVTVASLLCQSITDSSLAYHLRSAGKNGITRTEIAEIGEPNTAYASCFTGRSYLAPVSREQVSISNVTFEPRCRNYWHVHKASHGGGQMLIGVAGRGWYQQAGHCAVAILPGTVVHIPANTKHRHDGRRHLVRPPGR